MTLSLRCFTQMFHLQTIISYFTVFWMEVPIFGYLKGSQIPSFKSLVNRKDTACLRLQDWTTDLIGPVVCVHDRYYQRINDWRKRKKKKLTVTRDLIWYHSKNMTSQIWCKNFQFLLHVPTRSLRPGPDRNLMPCMSCSWKVDFPAPMMILLVEVWAWSLVGVLLPWKPKHKPHCHSKIKHLRLKFLLF